MRFNTAVSETKKTINLAGGEAFIQSPELELANLMLTSFLSDKFYETSKDQLIRLKNLVSQVSPEFAAKCALYARREFGMRSVSHVVAGELCAKVTKESWMKDFLTSIVYRPDDLTEITAYYMSLKPDQKITNAMRKGFGRALSKMDEYQVAKYKGAKNAISLVDCVNLYHPKATPALTALVKGTLKAPETWEVKLSEAGKSEDVETAKSEAWEGLLKSKKLGYFALLRNLRNILEQSPQNIDLACEMLTDEKQIKKSLVLPFRYITALKEIQSIENLDRRKINMAISKAVDISLSNIPELKGNTLIVLDESGSMSGKPIEIGALFAAALYKHCTSNLMLFSTGARFITPDLNSSTLGIAAQIEGCITPQGTNFHAIFEALNSVYDRIIILSDMQGWIGYNSASVSYNKYCNRTKSRPHVYSFDLNGAGSMQFPERNVYCLAGFSEKVFDLMGKLEEDRNVLVNTIKAYPIMIN